MGTSLQIPRLTTPPSTNTIRQSLNLSSSTSPSTFINRSSSVKVSKYDYRNNDLEDEFDDTVQIRRAVSVKKNGLSRSASVGAHPQQAGRLLVAKPTMVRIVTRTEGGVTRKASVKSADPAPRTTTTNMTNDSNSHLVATTTTTTTPSTSSADDDDDDDDNVLLRAEDSKPRTSSWISQQSGEITVIWDRHDNNNNAESSADVK